MKMGILIDQAVFQGAPPSWETHSVFLVAEAMEQRLLGSQLSTQRLVLAVQFGTLNAGVETVWWQFCQ